MSDGVLDLNPNDLTIGDLETFEEIVGKDFFEVMPDTDAAAASWRPSAKVLVALVYLINRKADPAFTLDDARGIRVTELRLGDATPTPTVAAG